MIQLIATDLDNTLLDERGKIPPEAVQLLGQARKLGVLTAVATGRCYPSALEAARTIGSDTPVICYNGSLVRRGGDILSQHFIPTEEIQAVSRFCHEQSLYLQLYHEDVIVVEALCDQTRLDPDLPVVSCREIGDFRTAQLHPTPKMLIVDQPERVAFRLDQLAKAFPRLAFSQSQPWLIEVMPPDANKGLALAQLAGLLGLEAGQVLALGDNTNDLPMLLWAGVGATVANAAPQVKAQADYVCAAPRSQGVMEAVRRFVLEGRS